MSWFSVEIRFRQSQSAQFRSTNFSLCANLVKEGRASELKNDALLGHPETFITIVGTEGGRR